MHAFSRQLHESQVVPVQVFWGIWDRGDLLILLYLMSIIGITLTYKNVKFLCDF